MQSVAGKTSLYAGVEKARCAYFTRSLNQFILSEPRISGQFAQRLSAVIGDKHTNESYISLARPGIDELMGLD